MPNAAVTLGKIVVRDHNMTEIIVTVYNELKISESVSSLRSNGVTNNYVESVCDNMVISCY